MTQMAPTGADTTTRRVEAILLDAARAAYTPAETVPETVDYAATHCRACGRPTTGRCPFPACVTNEPREDA